MDFLRDIINVLKVNWKWTFVQQSKFILVAYNNEWIVGIKKMNESSTVGNHFTTYIKE